MNYYVEYIKRVVQSKALYRGKMVRSVSAAKLQPKAFSSIFPTFSMCAEIDQKNASNGMSVCSLFLC